MRARGRMKGVALARCCAPDSSSGLDVAAQICLQIFPTRRLGYLPGCETPNCGRISGRAN